MNKAFWFRLPMLLMATGLVITATAWQGQHGRATHTTNDTIPERNKKVKDVDDAHEELERSKAELDRMKNIDMEKMQKELQESMKNMQVNMEKMQKDLLLSMKEFDAAKVQADVQKALKEVDMEKMKVQMEKALTSVDSEKMKADLEKAMKEIDMAKMQEEMTKALSKIDVEKLKEQTQLLKELEMPRIEEQMKKMGPEIEKSMKDARESIEKAKEELKAYKGFIDGLDKDGLIKKTGNYTIEYKKGGLTINGKKQPAAIVKKYSNFLEGHKDFTIRKDDDDFNISNDHD